MVNKRVPLSQIFESLCGGERSTTILNLTVLVEPELDLSIEVLLYALITPKHAFWTPVICSSSIKQPTRRDVVLSMIANLLTPKIYKVSVLAKAPLTQTCEPCFLCLQATFALPPTTTPHIGAAPI